MLYAEHLTKAQAIFRQFAQEVDRLTKDPDLTPEAKAKRRQTLQGQYDKSVAALRTEAAEDIERRRTIATRKLTQARAAEIERKRKLLGDAVLVDMIKAELQASPSKHIARWYEEAADGWEKEVVAGYGELIINARVDAADPENPDREDTLALRVLTQAEQAVADELRAARQVLKEVDRAAQAIEEGQLNRQVYVSERAVRTNLNPEMALAREAAGEQ